MEFYETFCVPTNGDFMKDNASDVTELHKRIVKVDTVGTGYEYASIDETTYASEAAGYVKDSRTGQDASYIPELVSWNFKPAGETDYSAYTEFKAQHILVVGKDALTRTGLAGEGNARVYVKAKGSAGVLDPIDQRQSIGFKINSVGFGSTRLEAIVDYVCVPSQVNAV